MFNKINGSRDNYEIKTLIDGQTVKMNFWRFDDIGERYVYSIYLRILDKNKKDYHESLSMKSKGRTGLKGLLYAKNQLVEFVSFIKEEKKISNVEFYLFWEDNRRQKVYDRGLKDLGFKFKPLLCGGVNKKHLYCKL